MPLVVWLGAAMIIGALGTLAWAVNQKPAYRERAMLDATCRPTDHRTCAAWCSSNQRPNASCSRLS